MAIETTSAADGNIEIMFLQQMGRDPFIPTPERTAQIREVARTIASFINDARSTLDIAIYDCRLHDEAAAIITEALRERAKNKVVIRIIYDATNDPGGDTVLTASPAHLESDRKPLGTESFVRSFSDIAEVKGITGYRVLMHSKYIVRDGNSAEAAVFTGSSNYTNDSWGLQENNLLYLRSQLLASYFSKDFADLLSHGRIVDTIGNRNFGIIRVAGVPVTVAFAPGESPVIVKEIVGAITAARRRLYVASVVLSSGPILAACLKRSTETCRSPASMMGRKWIRLSGSGRPPMSALTRSTPGKKSPTTSCARIRFHMTPTNLTSRTIICTTSL